MRSAIQPTDTPLYCLDSFSKKADQHAFYIEDLQAHLKNHEFISKPHRHDFYLLLYIRAGNGKHTIDFQNYKVSAGNFFLMTPGQVHSWELSPKTSGFIIFFVPSFYRMGFVESSLLEFPFFHSLNPHPLVHTDSKSRELIQSLLVEMHNEFNSSLNVDLRILRSYLEIILLKIARLYQHDNAQQALPTLQKTRKLEQLIDRNFAKLHQPRQYAELMHLSPSYLNNICKETLGKTLTDLISERIILEAKRLFAYSNLNVDQVSRKLNFTDPSYFIRFFKKHTQYTPEQFKQTLNRAI
jgi:AraC family transcriptional activator of pobA